mmetsp:Transcript_14492/g.36676  ORF Transcript_14492/g.36676 Transcript_14492/m.36676 type:complete len:337 (+) Transcript_14492:655-1665(+)
MAAQQKGGSEAFSDGPRTLWMGDLTFWMDENFLLSLFSATGEVLSVKVIRNKMTGYSEGYGFIEFVSNFAAQRVLQTYNGAPIAGTDQFFRLNWASGGGGKSGDNGQEDSDGSEHSVFVGDLSPEVTDYALQEFFRAYYPTVRSARVVTDPVTGRSKGYGFVRFTSDAERDRAMTEMSGQMLGQRAIRVCLATPKRAGGSASTSGNYGGAGGVGGQPGRAPRGPRHGPKQGAMAGMVPQAGMNPYAQMHAGAYYGYYYDPTAAAYYQGFHGGMPHVQNAGAGVNPGKQTAAVAAEPSSAADSSSADNVTKPANVEEMNRNYTEMNTEQWVSLPRVN